MKKKEGYTKKELSALGAAVGYETPAATTKRLLREAIRNIRDAKRIVDLELVKHSDALERTGAAVDIAVADYRRSLDLLQSKGRNL
jgi:hypothetical protein